MANFFFVLPVPSKSNCKTAWNVCALILLENTCFLTLLPTLVCFEVSFETRKRVGKKRSWKENSYTFVLSLNHRVKSDPAFWRSLFYPLSAWNVPLCDILFSSVAFAITFFTIRKFLRARVEKLLELERENSCAMESPIAENPFPLMLIKR